MSYDAHPLLATYSRLTGDLVDAVNRALDLYRQERSPDGPSLSKVRSLWRGIPDALASIDEATATLANQILTTTANRDLTSEARDRNIETLSDVAWIAVKTAVANVETRASTMLDVVRDAVYPSRPEPADAAQEARLAGIKSDCRMMLDPLGDGQAVVERLMSLLGRALATGDDLAAWLFAASTWPADYLTARGFDDYLVSLPVEIDDVVHDATPDAAALTSLYRTLADEQNGLPLLATLLGGTLDRLFADIKAWRPNPVTPTPPAHIDAYPGAGADVRAAAQAAANHSAMSF